MIAAKSEPWEPIEHIKFVQGVRTFGKNWNRITQFIETRSKA